MAPTLWLEAKGMDARFSFCMERLWHTEGVRSLTEIAGDGRSEDLAVDCARPQYATAAPYKSG